MSIMTRCCSESTLVWALCLLARDDKVYCLFARQSIRTIEKMKSCKTPVYTVQTKVLGVVVLELILAL